MSLEEKRRLILAMDVIIRSKVPGKAGYMAKRLGVSRSTFFRLLEYMREELSAPVFFDAEKNRYAYQQDGIILFRFLPLEVIDLNQARKIIGGRISKIFCKSFQIVSTIETH